MKTVLMVVVFVVVVDLHIFGQAQRTQLIGQDLHNLEFSNLVNFPSNAVSLRDFNGKIVLLDFWATTCVPCVAGMPKLQKLQERFAANLQVILITSEEHEKIKAFFAKTESRGNPVSLPSVTGDTSLYKFFGVQGVPDYVWIDRGGKVQAITGGEQVTAENLEYFIQYGDINLPVSNTVPLEITDSSIPFGVTDSNSSDGIIYHSYLSAYKEGLRSTSRNVGNSIRLVNTSALSLFRQAYGGMRYSQVIVELKDPKSVQFNEQMGSDLEEWQKKNIYCYELIVPESRISDKHQLMQEDLARYFPEIAAHVEKRKFPYLILRVTDRNKLHTTAAEPAQKWDVTGISVTNKPLKTVAGMVNYYMQDRIILDETDYSDGVDITLDATMYKLEEVKEALKSYGLELMEEERDADYLILKDKK